METYAVSDGAQVALFGADEGGHFTIVLYTPLCAGRTPLGISIFRGRGYSYFCKVTPCLTDLTVEGEGERARGGEGDDLVVMEKVEWLVIF